MTPPFFGDGINISRAAAATTARFLRLTINSSGQWAIAGAATKSQAVSWEGRSSGEDLNARLLDNGTTIMTASGAVTVGDQVYAAASGKVSATSAGVLEGVALTAASADGDQIAVVPEPAVSRTWVAFTHTVTAGEATATEAVINTGLGVVLNFCAFVVKTSAGVPRVADVATYGTGANAGKITIGSAALAENDIIEGIAGYDAYAV